MDIFCFLTSPWLTHEIAHHNKTGQHTFWPGKEWRIRVLNLWGLRQAKNSQDFHSHSETGLIRRNILTLIDLWEGKAWFSVCRPNMRNNMYPMRFSLCRQATWLKIFESSPSFYLLLILNHLSSSFGKDSPTENTKARRGSSSSSLYTGRHCSLCMLKPFAQGHTAAQQM